MTEGTVRTAAATATRAVTAAAGDQPASISDDPNDPDVLKAAAERTASPAPTPGFLVIDGNTDPSRTVMSKVEVASYVTVDPERSQAAFCP
jgi:hypothetical protein